MNDSTKRPHIKLAVDWLKGLKMDIPHSRWVMFAIGVYVLAAAFDKVASALGALAPLIQ
jgi:hypothetical protein